MPQEVSEILSEVFRDELGMGLPVESELTSRLNGVAAKIAGSVVGCGWVRPDGLICWIVVRNDWRQRGVGWAILKTLEHMAWREGNQCCFAAAVETAMPFYRSLGYSAFGDAWEEDGHRWRHVRKCIGGTTPDM